MTAEEFGLVRDLLYEQAGIVLDSSKGYLVESRLAPLVRKRKAQSLSDLIAGLRGSVNGLHREVLEAMVTTETSFFRDHHPWEILRTVILPRLIERRTKEQSLTIWSAACASGQEPYSVAMLIREHFPELGTWRIRIMASDLSRDMIDRARRGKYFQVEANRGLPAHLLVKYFRQECLNWQLTTEIRDLVEFREFNLKESWTDLPQVDLLILRNVMIYFDVNLKRQLFAKIKRTIRPDGYLLLGGAETAFAVDGDFQRVNLERSSFYELRPVRG